MAGSPIVRVHITNCIRGSALRVLAIKWRLTAGHRDSMGSADHYEYRLRDILRRLRGHRGKSDLNGFAMEIHCNVLHSMTSASWSYRVGFRFSMA